MVHHIRYASVALVVAFAACGGGPDGAQCASPNECMSGTCALLSANTEGKKGICAHRCDNGGACPAGEHCVGALGGGVCLKSCTTDTQCMDGFTCVEQPAVGGACFVHPSGKPTGGSCSGSPLISGSECQGAICIQLNANAQNETGICSQLCDTTPCPSGQTCIAVAGQMACFEVCHVSSDCIDGFACVPSGTGQNICLVTR
jgi:hypothetical protein